MSDAVLHGATRGVSRDELLDRVAALTPLLKETAAESEALGTLSSAAVEAFHDAGLFRLWSAREVGGYDVSVADQLHVLMAVARADMSACWSLMIGASSSAVMASRLPDGGVAEPLGGGRSPASTCALTVGTSPPSVAASCAPSAFSCARGGAPAAAV